MNATPKFDFDKTYRVEGYSGIAWRANHYERILDEDFEWSGIEHYNTDRVVCTMIGDDSDFTFDTDELTPLTDDQYCPECGQIGCKAYG